MGPRQLLLELEEVEMAAEKGSKRVRADSTNEGSLQVQLHSQATAWGITWQGLHIADHCLTICQSSGSGMGREYSNP
eukprot:scaffold4264_cov116-Isochrysis_galbana.AAC.12